MLSILRRINAALTKANDSIAQMTKANKRLVYERDHLRARCHELVEALASERVTSLALVKLHPNGVAIVDYKEAFEKSKSYVLHHDVISERTRRITAVPL